MMIGGFLGAGKTTAIARLARHYIDQGLRVGLVTNDQAYDLVDTQSLRAQGFSVGEVPGACFCCKFNDLIETAAQLGREHQPDLILTEPVGSCTDLVATVIEPLRHLHQDQYDLTPLAVLLKPEHGTKILGGVGQGQGFSPKAEYIFLKQIEEAGIVVLNKIDKLTIDERSRLMQCVEERFPGKEVLAVSAKTGAGFERLIEALDQPASSRPAMEVDYQIYAEGEAELGWLNCTAEVASAEPDHEFQLDALLVELVEHLAAALEASSAEPAHLKVLGLSDGQTGIANLVASDSGVELSLASEVAVQTADLIVNARVAVDPQLLAKLVERELAEVCRQRKLRLTMGQVQCFRPSPPVPTHRMA